MIQLKNEYKYPVFRLFILISYHQEKNMSSIFFKNILGVMKLNKTEENKVEEAEYLEKTISYLRSEIDKGEELIANRRRKLIASRRNMWENTAHHSEDFEKMTEVNQQLIDVTNETGSYLNTLGLLEKYKKVIDNPYFGRFDFIEEGLCGKEKIYIGMHNIMDLKVNNILVYDWRAPVSSIFYQYELGEVAYKSPMGEIKGEMSLKRQYKIGNQVLKYFFDCNLRITDELLQEVLSHNTSVKMRNIVETIQREQDVIIRDIDNELLIVQGVAGSGKTSIALHRIAFLLYSGATSVLESNNIMIISPNSVFSKYISSVLPELGEENVCETTFDEIIKNHLGERFILENRSAQLEYLIGEQDKELVDFKRSNIEFKGSEVFGIMLRRLIQEYERKLIPFEDISYGSIIVESRDNLKNRLLNNKINMPLRKRLKTLENRILDKVHPLQRKRLERIESIVVKEEEHQLEIKAFSRLLSVRETNKFMKRIRQFTEIDYFNLYKLLFNNHELFLKLAKGLILPENIKQIIDETSCKLRASEITYEDSGALLYLKLMLEGSDYFSKIRQVVIDEAQDYYPIQYEVFKLLFPNSKYTVLGDINQTIEKSRTKAFYEEVAEVFGKVKTNKLSLNKSYRSSSEINQFNQKLLTKKDEFISFERHEDAPRIVYSETLENLEEKMVHDINYYLEEGFETIAIICKTQWEAEIIHSKLAKATNVKLVNSPEIEMEKGVWVIPVYMSKGLEFDVVLVYGVSKDNYFSEFDRELLYIACTRALHRLELYYTGEKSVLI
jgi:DNA helicase II / ATP-dependent DNA helicase PcrA